MGLAARVGVLAVVAAMLVACGAAEGSSGAAGGGGEAGSPQVGGTLTLQQQTEPRLLDPALLSNAASGTTLFGNSLYGQLLTVGADGAIEYGLAEDLSTSDGGTTWELTLRDGLTFSDGSTLDAEAVQFNWERLRDPSTGSASITQASYIATMNASGQVLEFTLLRPIVGFPSAIAESLNWIAAPDALGEGPQAFDANPIGAGPFVLESWQRGGEMVLVRNERYFDSPRPYLDRLVLASNTDTNQRLASVTSGGIDGATFSNPDIFAMAEDQGLTATSQELGGAIGMGMNTRIAPFDDVRARQAVHMGVDREALNAAVYSGFADVPETLFADGSEYNGDAQLPAYDPEAAQELFTELAAEGRPVEFTITAFQTTEGRRVSENVQAQLGQYDDVSVELEVLDFPTALAATAQRDFQMINSGAVFLDPASVVFQQLHSSSAGNLTGISDPQLDEALDAALSATDEEARAAAYREVAAIYCELVPSFSYVRSNFSLITSDRVHGAELYGIGAVRTDTLWVAE